MKKYIEVFGVSEESVSPSCKILASAKYLRQYFKEYFPKLVMDDIVLKRKMRATNLRHNREWGK